MPKYDEIIEESAKNLRSLGNKLEELDRLNQSINGLKNGSTSIQREFGKKFKEIATLSKQYTELLGETTSTYLDGNNTLFTSKIDEFSDRNAELKKQVARLEKVDLINSFNSLESLFLKKTKESFKVEFQKLDTKTENFQSKIKNFQLKINELREETTRLKKIDLEVYFEKHQTKLSDILNSISKVNLTLTEITSSLNAINQTLGQNQQHLSTFIGTIEQHLSKQDRDIEEVFNNLKTEIEKLKNQNNTLQKAGEKDRIILIVGLVLILLSIGLFNIFA